MGRTKTSKGVAPNISSAANPAASSTTQIANKSSILRSSFSPSKLQLSLFASVIQGLDSQHLRIHETASGRLRCEHAIASRASITCLDWGYHGGNRDRHHQDSKKKRKRSALTNGDVSSPSIKDPVIAFGTSDSEVHLFSISEAKVSKTLGGAHTQGIRDFKFKEHGIQGEGWSIGGDGKLVQWDFKKGIAVRSLTLPHGPANTLRPLGTSVIYASRDAYILDPNSKEQQQPAAFHASTNYVHTIIDTASHSPEPVRFLTAAETDRFINVFSADSTTLIGSLRTEDEILSLDGYSTSDQSKGHNLPLGDMPSRTARPREAIVAVNKAGAVEIFPDPFDFGDTSKEESKGTKARMQKRTRPRDALVRIRRPDSSIVPVLNASFQGDDIAVIWAEGGVNLVFEKIQWRDEDSGSLILKDTTDIMKAKTGPGLGAITMNGVKDMGKSHVDESHAVVVNGGDADDVSMDDDPQQIIEISSAEESESEDESPARLLEDAEAGAVEKDEDVEMEDTDAQEAVDQGETKQPEEIEAPSFGDLIRANAPDAVDVQASFADPNAQSLVPAGDRTVQQLPSGMSFGTVLTQALRTNDTNLLQSCFHAKDLRTIRATIERLDSTFASILLRRIAERFHSRPGRAGSLLVWIQWTVVAHGGYLAGQPDLMKKLASLYRVVKDRGAALQALLPLKGRLDMVVAQQNIRKGMQARSRAAQALDEDDEEGVIYVEGQEESDSEDENAGERTVTGKRSQKRGANPVKQPDDDDSESDSDGANSDDEEESEDELPVMNGVAADSQDEASDSDEDGLIDDEASSTDNDSIDEKSEDEIDHESIDSVDSSDADASPPPKRAATSKLSNGIPSRKR